MTSVLVVDDAAVDRKLAKSLLTKQTGWTVDVCNDGVEAMEYVNVKQPDLIVSDLQMPNMDGFELVAAIKEKHPTIPVVIITSKGSEEMAMKALKWGAASFCPKNIMARDLNLICRNVLSVSSQRRQSEQVLSRLKRSDLAFELENDSTLIPPTIEHLQSHMVGWDETDRIRIGVALDESLMNAMHHGNLEVDSSLRNEGDGSAYHEVIATRVNSLPFKDRRVQLEAEISDEFIKVRIADEGPGFSPNLVPDPTSPENLHKPSGRGLLLIRTFMTDVQHNHEGNCITMIKRRED